MNYDINMDDLMAGFFLGVGITCMVIAILMKLGVV